MIRPVNYSLEFEPNLRNFTFNGKETIEIKISKPTKIISLNASELKIKKCHIIWGGIKVWKIFLLFSYDIFL